MLTNPCPTLLALLLAGACSAGWETPADAPPPQEPKPAAPRTAFSGRHALALVKAFIRHSPRVPGTPGSARARAFLRKELATIGLKAREQTFRMDTAAGPKTFVNLLATRKGSAPGRIVWAAHYDTPDFSADLEYLRAHDDRVFQGANDGGSGVAVLLELARVLQALPTPRMTHQFLFLDGEEKIGADFFTPYLDDPQANACFGSRAQAKRWAKNPPRAVVLLDMVGDRDLHIDRETSYSAPEMLEIFARAARKAGHAIHFFQTDRGIVDDHVPFSQQGIPTIDLIDFSYGPPDERGKGRWWHSPEDTADKLSARSLQIVGEVCLAAIPLLGARFAHRRKLPPTRAQSR